MRQWIGSALVQKMACRLLQTNAGLLPIGSSRTNLSEILIKIQNFPFTKKHLKISSAKWQPFYPGGDELTVGMSWPDMPHNRNLRSFKRLLQTITDYSIDRNKVHVMFDNDIFNPGINVLNIKVFLITETYACWNLLGIFVIEIDTFKKSG